MYDTNETSTQDTQGASKHPVFKLVYGDCIEYIPTLATQEIPISCVLADPPYMVGMRSVSATKMEVHKQQPSTIASWADAQVSARWWERFCSALDHIRSEELYVFVFCNTQSLVLFYPSLYARFRHVNSLVWNKGSGGYGGMFRKSHELILCASNAKSYSKPRKGANLSDVLTIPRVSVSKRIHASEKPVALLRELIGRVTQEGDVILDPFAGSAAVSEACRELSRGYVGIELDPDTFHRAEKHRSPIAIERYESPALFPGWEVSSDG